MKTHRALAVLAVVGRHIRHELLRGPLGAPFVQRHQRMVSAIARPRAAGRRLWARLASIEGLSLGTRKLLFRALYYAPMGPGDSAAPRRVVARHRDLAMQIRRAVAA
jgi:hypothetical protein